MLQMNNYYYILLERRRINLSFSPPQTVAFATNTYLLVRKRNTEKLHLNFVASYINSMRNSNISVDTDASLPYNHKPWSEKKRNSKGGRGPSAGLCQAFWGAYTSNHSIRRSREKLTTRTPLTSTSRHFLQCLQPNTDGVTGTPSWKAHNTNTKTLHNLFHALLPSHTLSISRFSTKLLAQKPDRAAAVFGGECKCITIFIEQVVTHVLTPNLEDLEFVLIRPLSTGERGTRDSFSAPFSPRTTKASLSLPPGRHMDVLFMTQNCSAVESFRCLTAMPPEGSTRAGILPGCPSLDRGSREAEVGFEPRTFRSVSSRSNHFGRLAPLMTQRKVPVQRPVLCGIEIHLEAVVRTQPLYLDCPCLGLGDLTASQPERFLRAAWQLGTER
ncbi:hypothetical protein CSKR_104954 [Clonorchis sinensis]|uniref:Uncharacterized protein n=1 Tax=Clonorchis sinensis TaxID=79923 RepID=A0A419Q735_CLOSI|nr:hypothetical protein CSKR_104954 [Clonorchis sinensis]